MRPQISASAGVARRIWMAEGDAELDMVELPKMNSSLQIIPKCGCLPRFETRAGLRYFELLFAQSIAFRATLLISFSTSAAVGTRLLRRDASRQCRRKSTTRCVSASLAACG